MSIATSPSTIPRLRGLPLLGNLLDARHDFLTFLLRLSRECGSIGTFRVGSRTILYLNSPELVHAVLVEHAYDFEKTPNMRTYMGSMVGNGLLTSENEFHKRQRKLTAPAFQHRRIAVYADTMVNYTNRFQGQWTTGCTFGRDWWLSPARWNHYHDQPVYAASASRFLSRPRTIR